MWNFSAAEKKLGSVENLVFSTKDKTHIDGGDSACTRRILLDSSHVHPAQWVAMNTHRTAPALCDDVRITFSGIIVIWGMPSSAIR